MSLAVNWKSNYVNETAFQTPSEMEDEDEYFEQDASDSCPMQPLVSDDQLSNGNSDQTARKQPLNHHNLSWDLRLLFALIGASLALPMMALMFLVNSQIKLPLSLLPAYGAICFVPYSLKPLYAILTQAYARWVKRRHHSFCQLQETTQRQHHEAPSLLTLLFLLQAAALMGTLWISSVTGLFVAGFLRGISGSFPEFVLELELVHQVGRLQESMGKSSDTTSAASMLQSQAATARNFGSWAGHVLATLSLLLGSMLTGSSTGMNQSMAGWLLSLTAALNLLGGLLATFRQVRGAELESSVVAANEDELPQHAVLDDEPTISIGTLDDTDDAELTDLVEAASESTAWSSYRGKSLVCLLQVAVIVLVIQGPMTASSSAWLWYSAMCFVGILLLGSVLFVSLTNQPFTYRAGLFLILRNAMPTASYLLASYVYELFESHPVVIQLLSVLDMGVLTLASWSYGVLFGTLSKDPIAKDGGTHSLYRVMIGTTILAAIVSLVSQLILTNVIPGVPSLVMQASALFVVQSLGTVVGEWKFMPDVVLATIASTTSDSCSNRQEFLDEECATTSTSGSCQPAKSFDTGSKAVQYGSLISCIDFGGQLNAVSVGLLVNVLDISRKNDWKNLDALVVVGALSSCLSIALIRFLLRPTLS